VIKQAAIRNGMETLRMDGWNKVLSGITTIEEVLRVTKAD
jgi:type II secretory ATPase GspE/PulE/Tfp pilus assembly ATPase PilB-like protein